MTTLSSKSPLISVCKLTWRTGFPTTEVDYLWLFVRDTYFIQNTLSRAVKLSNTQIAQTIAEVFHKTYRKHTGTCVQYLPQAATTQFHWGCHPSLTLLLDRFSSMSLHMHYQLTFVSFRTKRYQ